MKSGSLASLYLLLWNIWSEVLLQARSRVNDPDLKKSPYLFSKTLRRGYRGWRVWSARQAGFGRFSSAWLLRLLLRWLRRVLRGWEWWRRTTSWAAGGCYPCRWGRTGWERWSLWKWNKNLNLERNRARFLWLQQGILPPLPLLPPPPLLWCWCPAPGPPPFFSISPLRRSNSASWFWAWGEKRSRLGATPLPAADAAAKSEPSGAGEELTACHGSFTGKNQESLVWKSSPLS